MDKLQYAAELISASKNLIVLTGAGMSTESGLKDFRSKDGLASGTYEGYYPEEILSRGFFYHNTALFYQYLKEKLNVSGYSPNKGHQILAEWEKKREMTIITQNIDSFHQKAGSTHVIEVHGTLAECTCLKCRMEKPLSLVLKEGYTCPCGGIYKPNIVLYDEEVTEISRAFSVARAGDLLMVLGTSLKVYPAASIPEIYGINHKRGIIINRDETLYSHHYNVTEINDGIGASLQKIDSFLKKIESSRDIDQTTQVLDKEEQVFNKETYSFFVYC